MVPMNRHHFFYLLIFTFLSFSPQDILSQEAGIDLNTALQKIESKKLWEHKVWLRLGYYSKKTFGGYESLVDSGLFFNSKNGKFDPRAELINNITGFYSSTISSKENPNSQCKFPARLKWIQSEVGKLNIPNIKCEYQTKFKNKIKAQSVSIVFSSYYMNNPGSTFGHTFLRFNKSKQSEVKDGESRNELLDMAFSYAANIPPNAPGYLMLGGLVGLLPGSLSALPYYFKVREYNDFEDRDLWSYELNLSEDEVHQLVNVLWELSLAGTEYYFFDDNCAYIILAAIETAAPHLNITERLRPWVIPADTIKVVAKYPGLVTDIKYRPSVRKHLFKRIKNLSPHSKKIFDSLTDDKGQSDINIFLDQAKSTEGKVKILDTLTDYISFLYPKEVQVQKTKSYKWKNKVLMARAALPVSSPTLHIKPLTIERPDLGHESMRFGLLGGQHEDRDETIIQGELRFAIHDELDGELGFPKNSQVEFFNVKARYSESEKFKLLDWALLRVASYTPQDFIKTTSSSRMETGIRRIFDQNCDDDYCVGGYFEIGKGYSIKPFTNGPLVTYFFVDFEMMYSQEFLKNSFRVGLGPRAGIIYNASRDLKFHLNGFYHYLPWTEYENYSEAQLRGRWSQNTHLAWDISVSHRYKYGTEGLLGLYVYF